MPMFKYLGCTLQVTYGPFCRNRNNNKISGFLWKWETITKLTSSWEPVSFNVFMYMKQMQGPHRSLIKETWN